jgi:hypothetical protein
VPENKVLTADQISCSLIMALEGVQSFVNSTGPVPSPNNLFWRRRKICYDLSNVWTVESWILDRCVRSYKKNGDKWASGAYHMKPRGDVAYSGHVVVGKPSLWCQAPVIIFVELGYFYLSQYVFKSRKVCKLSENLFLSFPPPSCLSRATCQQTVS